MGKKDTFSLTSIPTDVKDASSTKKVTLESKKKREKPAPSVDIERLKKLHQERMDRAAEIKQKTLDNIARLKDDDERKRRDVCNKLDAKARRVEEKQAITEALSEYAKNKKNIRINAGGSRRTYVDTIVYQYEQNPGPHYDPGKLRDRLNAPGIKMSEGNPKSEIEWCEYRAKQLPGPGQYTDVKYELPHGGRLGPCGPDVVASKNYIEWEEYRAKQLPGPAEYSVPKGARIGACSGGVFPKFTPPGLVEASVRANAYKPGPGEYKVDASSKAGPAACISKSSGKSDVDWAIYRASQLPGPGQYSSKNTGAMGNKVSSGHGRTAGATHICRAERKTITDIQVERRRGMPGPGEYGNFRTPSREAEIRGLKKAALQQIKEHEATRAKSSLF